MSGVTAVENPHAGQGSVVLDIGGDIGALVVSMPAAFAGKEVEICPAGRRDTGPDEGRGWWAGEWRGHPHAPEHPHGHAHEHVAAWPHVGVLPRATPAGTRHAAVFPGLRAGDYELWLRPAEPTALVVSVGGGAVAEAVWPQGQGG